MNTPHVHAEVIKAWADGKPVQWYEPCLKKWVNLCQTVAPCFMPSAEYRIAPEVKSLGQVAYEAWPGSPQSGWDHTVYQRKYQAIAEAVVQAYIERQKNV